jgi:hypothetical protein
MSKKNTTTRRAFLKGAAALAGAAPLALVPAAAAAATGVGKSGLYDDPYARVHNPARAASHMCDCMSCYARDRDWSNHPLLLAALGAAQGALDALARVEDDGGDLAADADAAINVIQNWYDDATSFLVGVGKVTHRPAPAPRAARSSPQVAAVLSLYDLYDSLLDLVAFHGDGDATCYPCEHADKVVYHVRRGIDNLTPGGGPGGGPAALLVVEQRELLSAKRKVARARKAAAEGVEFRLHSGRCHADAEGDVAAIEESLARQRALLDQGGKTVRRGRRA